MNRVVTRPPKLFTIPIRTEPVKNTNEPRKFQLPRIYTRRTRHDAPGHHNKTDPPEEGMRNQIKTVHAKAIIPMRLEPSKGEIRGDLDENIRNEEYSESNIILVPL
jgi:hypothetical protein